jgi:hypothetical protein
MGKIQLPFADWRCGLVVTDCGHRGEWGQVVGTPQISHRRRLPRLLGLTTETRAKFDIRRASFIIVGVLLLLIAAYSEWLIRIGYFLPALFVVVLPATVGLGLLIIGIGMVYYDDTDQNETRKETN